MSVMWAKHQEIGRRRWARVVRSYDLRPDHAGCRVIIEAGLIVGPAGGEPAGRRWVWVRRRDFCCLFDIRHVLHDIKEQEREDAVELGALLNCTSDTICTDSLYPSLSIPLCPTTPHPPNDYPPPVQRLPTPLLPSLPGSLSTSSSSHSLRYPTAFDG